MVLGRVGRADGDAAEEVGTRSSLALFIQGQKGGIKGKMEEPDEEDGQGRIDAEEAHGRQLPGRAK